MTGSVLGARNINLTSGCKMRIMRALRVQDKLVRKDNNNTVEWAIRT